MVNYKKRMQLQTPMPLSSSKNGFLSISSDMPAATRGARSIRQCSASAMRAGELKDFASFASYLKKRIMGIAIKNRMIKQSIRPF